MSALRSAHRNADARDGVGSAGVTFRVNLLGFAVGQFDFAHSFQRLGRGRVFQFTLSPGY